MGNTALNPRGVHMATFHEKSAVWDYNTHACV